MEAMTNVSIPSGPDVDFWRIHTAWHDASGVERVVDLNPRSQPLWLFAAWIRVGDTILLTMLMAQWVRRRLQHLVSVGFMIPGSSPLKAGGWGAVLGAASWGLGLVAIGEIVLQLPVLLGGFLTLVTSQAGLTSFEWISDAIFSGLFGSAQVGVPLASGGAGPTIFACLKEALWVLDDLFPLVFSLGLLAYTWIFDRVAFWVFIVLWSKLRVRSL